MASTRPGPRLPDRALRRLLCPPFTHSRALIDRVPVDAAVMLMSTALRGETVAVPTGRSRDRPLYLRSATSTLILARLSPAPIWFGTHCQFDTAAYDDPRLFEGSGSEGERLAWGNREGGAEGTRGRIADGTRET